MNAYNDLIDFLKGEEVEAIVIGTFRDMDAPKEGEKWSDTYYWDKDEEEVPLVPFNLRGKVLTLKELKPYMKGWSFNGDYGGVECYSVHVWTKLRVVFVVCYDGATWLSSVPRNPCNEIPVCHGGG